MGFHLYKIPKVVKYFESRMGLPMAWRGLNGELGFNACRVSVWNDEKVLEINSGDDYTAM